MKTHQLPLGWRRLAIGELVTDRGLFVDGDWVESKDQDPNGEIRLIQLADIKDGYFESNSSKHLTDDKAKELRCTPLKMGDILVARMPDPLGRACIFPGSSQECITAVDVCILRPNNPLINIAWLKYAINSPETRKQIIRLSRGTTRNRISRKDFSKIQLSVPPLDTQRKIVAILEKAEATQRLRAEADALMKKLVQSVFLEMFGDPATNPLGWTIKKLDDVCSEIYRYPTFYGFDYVNSGTPVIRIGNIKLDGYIDPDLTNYVFIEQTISDRFPRTKIELYDILMAVRGDGSTAKRIGLVHSNDLIGANISPNLLRIKADINYLNPFYLFNLLVSESGQKILERYVTRTAKKTITSQNIKGISIPIPPLSLQNKFQKLSLSIINAQNAQDQSNVELSNLFSNTIARAFTGDLIA